MLLKTLHKIAIASYFKVDRWKGKSLNIFCLAVLASVYGVCSCGGSPGGNHLYLQSLKPPHTRNFQNFHFRNTTSLGRILDEKKLKQGIWQRGRGWPRWRFSKIANFKIFCVCQTRQITQQRICLNNSLINWNHNHGHCSNLGESCSLKIFEIYGKKTPSLFHSIKLSHV